MVPPAQSIRSWSTSVARDRHGRGPGEARGSTRRSCRRSGASARTPRSIRTGARSRAGTQIGMPSATARSSPPHWSRWWWVWATATTSRTPVWSSTSRIAPDPKSMQKRRARRRSTGTRCRCRDTTTATGRAASGGRGGRSHGRCAPPAHAHAGTARRRAGVRTSIASSASSLEAQRPATAARRAPAGGRSPSHPSAAAGSGRRCPGPGRCGRRSRPRPARR